VREINVSRSGDLSMREIRLLRGRLPRKGGGLTGMLSLGDIPPRDKNWGAEDTGHYILV
jgi:hypothetical protein